MVFTKESDQYLNTVFLWFHETGQLENLGLTFNEIKEL